MDNQKLDYAVIYAVRSLHGHSDSSNASTELDNGCQKRQGSKLELVRGLVEVSLLRDVDAGPAPVVGCSDC